MSEISESGLAAEFVDQAVDLLHQSLIKIHSCLGQLTTQQIWWRPDASQNSIGNLILHIAGNLQQWGVVPLTGGLDQRDRDLEFAARAEWSSDQLLATLTETTNEAERTWSGLSPETLIAIIEVQGFEVSCLQAILHTSSHFVGHTHQIILLTRLQLGPAYQFAWTPESGRGELPI